MKQIINGRKYDTDTAKELGSYSKKEKNNNQYTRRADCNGRRSGYIFLICYCYV